MVPGEAKGLAVDQQRLGNAFVITVYVEPRRNGEANWGAFNAANKAIALVKPCAYDADEPPATEQPAASAPVMEPLPESMAAALERDLRAGRVQLDDTVRYPTPGCTSGACSED